MASPDAFVTLYRAVNFQEAHDIGLSGGLRRGSGSAYCEGKWFATSFTNAVRWGERMPPVGERRPFVIVEVRVAFQVVENSLRFDRLDGVGPAVFVLFDDLRLPNSAVIISMTDVDRKEPSR